MSIFNIQITLQKGCHDGGEIQEYIAPVAGVDCVINVFWDGSGEVLIGDDASEREEQVPEGDTTSFSHFTEWFFPQILTVVSSTPRSRRIRPSHVWR